MKQSILLIIMVSFLASCNQKEDNIVGLKEYNFPQKWVLVQMSGNVPNSITSGDNMSWQEYYILNQDGSFIKSRTMEGVKTEEKGTYAFDLRVDGKFLIPTFSKSNSIIGTCYQGLNEELWLENNAKAVSSWAHCDGPGLIYERKE